MVWRRAPQNRSATLRHLGAAQLRNRLSAARNVFRLLDTYLTFNRFLIVQLNERLGQFISLVEGERLLEPDARVARCLANLFNPVLYPDWAQSSIFRRKKSGCLRECPGNA